jgi:pyrroline-5-carboxylate reductase
VEHPTVAILGAGSLGEIFARGLLRAGWSTDDIVLVSRRADRAYDLETATGINSVTSLTAGAAGRDVVLVAVKPKDVPSVVAEIGPVLIPSQVLVSFAAGVELAALQAALPGQPIIRAMPNTPAAVDLGMTALALGDSVSADNVTTARAVLGAVGETIELPEDLLDAVTAVSGTGPAYVFLLAEAMIEAAVGEGLSHQAAERLVHQTIRGSGELLIQSDLSAFRLRGQVTSPGGTTAAAMHVLEEGGFRALVQDAVVAAAERSRELGKKAGDQ